MHGHQIDAAVIGFSVVEGDADFVELVFLPAFNFDDLKHCVVGFDAFYCLVLVDLG